MTVDKGAEGRLALELIGYDAFLLPSTRRARVAHKGLTALSEGPIPVKPIAIACTAESAWPRIAWGAVGIGVVLRVVEYLLNRSLWADEADLALNILHRSWAGLLQPLDNHQGAPLAFLAVEKCAVRFMGTSEYALRLVPLLAGIASVFLFYRLASTAISTAAVPIAVGLFAISPPLIYYSSEVKQYSCDVAVTLLLYCLAFEGSASEWKPLRAALLGVGGSVAIWMSHPSAFVLGGIGLTIAAVLVAQRNWTRLARISVPFLMWAASLAVCYSITLRRLGQDRYLLDYWKQNFMPFPPRSVTDAKWFVDSFFGFFSGTAGLEFTGLAAFAFIVGSVSMFRRNREGLFLLLSPAILTLVVSGVHKYPFGGRLALFLVPATLLLMAEGAEEIRSAAHAQLPVIGLVLVGLLFLDPGIYDLHHFAKPHVEIVRSGVMLPEEIKSVMAYLRTHKQPGDLTYLFYGAQSAWQYYAERNAAPRGEIVMGTASGEDAHDYQSDLDRLRGRRVWIVFSHIHGVGAGESKKIEVCLEIMGGKRLASSVSAGAATYLYDLSGAKPLRAAHAESEDPGFLAAPGGLAPNAR